MLKILRKMSEVELSTQNCENERFRSYKPNLTAEYIGIYSEIIYLEIYLNSLQIELKDQPIVVE